MRRPHRRDGARARDFVELSTGQVSWHVHERELPWFAGLARYLPAWDGHTTEEKYERVLGAARANAATDIVVKAMETGVLSAAVTDSSPSGRPKGVAW